MTLQNYIKTNLNKNEMPITSNKFKTERYIYIYIYYWW